MFIFLATWECSGSRTMTYPRHRLTVWSEQFGQRSFSVRRWQVLQALRFFISSHLSPVVFPVAFPLVFLCGRLVSSPRVCHPLALLATHGSPGLVVAWSVRFCFPGLTI